MNTSLKYNEQQILFQVIKVAPFLREILMIFLFLY